MWNAKAKAIPVISGATGTISKSLRQYLSNIPENHEINCKKQPHWALRARTLALSISPESANVKVQNPFHGRKNMTCSTNRKYVQTAATLYTLKSCFFMYIIVNTLHKGVNKDDDNDMIMMIIIIIITTNVAITAERNVVQKEAEKKKSTRV
jgi:hypothetical protein